MIMQCRSQSGRCPRCNAEIKWENQVNMNIRPGENTRVRDAKKPKLVNSGSVASNTEEAANEAEECLVCLEPGFHRACCGEHYCNECFFKNMICPGCQTPCVARGFDYKIIDQGIWPIGVGWFVSHTISMAVVVLLIICCVDDLSRRETVHGQACFKFTERCDTRVCIEVNDTAADGAPRLGDPNDWNLCTAQSTGTRARGSACVFDDELYRRTGKRLGYDLCYGDLAREYDAPQGGLHGASVRTHHHHHHHHHQK